MPDTLAIVVPAYKKRFLHESLNSILKQTDQRFRLYVCDDGSPEDLAAVVRELLPNDQRFVVHHFANNVGDVSLVAHWKRSVACTREPWIWLFSDDDVMDQDCVQCFHDALARGGECYDLFRFDAQPIDAESRPNGPASQAPETETGWAFAARRLRREGLSCMQQFIFRRSRYLAIGGIPEFPKAWLSDDAFVLRMGLDRPIKRIGGAGVCFRQSGVNISSARSQRLTQEKFSAAMQYTIWLRSQAAVTEAAADRPDDAELDRLLRDWIEHRSWADAGTFIPWKTAIAFAFFRKRVLKESAFRILTQLTSRNLKAIRRGLRNGGCSRADSIRTGAKV